MPKTLSRTLKIHHPKVGVVHEVRHGVAFVNFPGNPAESAVRARSTIPVPADAAGRDAVLIFEEGDPRRPIILGLLQTPEKLVLSADEEIALKCGKASLTLTRAGKVLIRGAYVLSRSSGVNRVKGGSVEIN
ncbi:MAG: hypothetical protein HYY17_06770 [Planctomycetes bacterium]|nr:hypothetical protein [Planctomycetota bacterium]